MLFTGTVLAAVLRADRARSEKLLTKSCARTVDTHPSVGRGKFVLLRKILQTLLSKIDGMQHLRILRLEAVENSMQAGADLVVNVSGWLGCRLQLTCPCLKSFVRRHPPPVTINYSIAKQAEEPAYGRFARLKIIPVLKSTQVRGLQNVLGKLRVRDAALHECEKLLPLGE